MAGLLSNEPTHNGAPEGPYRASQERPEEGGGRWYFNRKEIEEDSPSRGDGIDLKKETYLRKSYCTFLQDLGMRLKVPQVTIATAIIFCHRFFLRQSHAKNDRRTIATVCMFLAGKVEETPRPLKDVILVSYEIIHKKDAAAVQRIKQKEVYEHQKELVLLGERMVLSTLAFDLNVLHPYKPLVEAIKKFKVAQNALAQVAWNFVNDGLRTSLCLQFKPHHIAAGAIFLAAKFLKVKLPSDGEKVWWQEFDVTPRQLEEVSNQMLELYEQNRVPQSQPSEAEASNLKGPGNDDHEPSYSSKAKPAPPRPVLDQSHDNSYSGLPRVQNNDYGSSETNSKEDDDINDIQHHEREPKPNSDETRKNDREGHSGNLENRDNKQEVKDKKLDREKLKAAFERRKAALGDITRKVDPMDELERELEDVELPHEKKSNRSKSSNREEFDAVEEGEVEPSDHADRGYQSPKSGSRKRKPGSPLDHKSWDGKQWSDYGQGFGKQNGLGRHGYSGGAQKRHLQENHV